MVDGRVTGLRNTGLRLGGNGQVGLAVTRSRSTKVGRKLVASWSKVDR